LPEILDLSAVAQSAAEYDKIYNGVLSNAVVSALYDDLADFLELEQAYEKSSVMRRKAFNIALCHKTIIFDHYKPYGVKDYKYTIRCHDKFCPLCQKDKANAREQKLHDVMAAASADYDLYHMVFTSKNCRGDLPPWLYVPNDDRPEFVPFMERMAGCFAKLIRYLSGNCKIKGLNFLQYGFAGAFRSLETTFYELQEYHPHYHVIFAVRKGVEFPGQNYNTFSYNKKTGKLTPFSDFTILIQKIWFLLLNGKEVTLDAINALPLGYSVFFDKIAGGGWHQIFKYIVKPAKQTSMNFNVFKDLYYGLDRKRSFQGFRCFHNLKLPDNDFDDNNPEFDKIIRFLRKSGEPEFCEESPLQVRDNILRGKSVYISRRKYRAIELKLGADGEIHIVLPEPEKPLKPVQTVFPLPASEDLKYLDGGRAVKPKKSRAAPTVAETDKPLAPAPDFYEVF
jgi:hypothetical protein